ncbi:DUF2523 family protein [Luteimonas sp. A277]
MAFPAILAGGAIAGVLIQVLRWFFFAYGAAVVMRVLGVLGLAYFTYEFVLDPAIQMIDANINALPVQLTEWMRALGIFEVFSIIVSAYLLLAGKRVFLGKRA